MYQPTAYKLNGRMGTRAQLKDMIDTCRAAGVRVYADAVINHMTGGGNDVWQSHRNGNGGGCAYWGPKESTGKSPFLLMISCITKTTALNLLLVWSILMQVISQPTSTVNVL